MKEAKRVTRKENCWEGLDRRKEGRRREGMKEGRNVCKGELRNMRREKMKEENVRK